MIIAFPLVCFDWSPFLELFDYFFEQPCFFTADPTARDELIQMIVDALHLEFKRRDGLLELLSPSARVAIRTRVVLARAKSQTVCSERVKRKI